MSITLRQVEIFLNVVELGHLTNVAKEMGLSQSAISMSIKELESVLGRPLFDRMNKKLILNETGRAFCKEIKPLYKKVHDIEHEFQNSVNKGMIRVGASTTIVDYFMPSIVCGYMQTYPEVKISLKEGNTKKIVDLIKEGQLDVGFVEGSVRDPEVIIEKVAMDELIIVTAKEGFEEPCFIDSLESQKWVLREPGSGTRNTFLECIKGKMNGLNIFLELGHTESIKSILKGKDAFSCLSKVAVEEDIKAGKLYQVPVKKFDCKREFSMVYHKDKFHSELFDKFTFFTKKMMASMIEEK
jgi:DNA-binding transcriptional LysR family regulator